MAAGLLYEFEEVHMQTQNQDSISEKNLSAFGLYTNTRDAKIAIDQFERNGFESDDISMLAPERSGRHDFVYEQKTSLKDGAVIGAIGGLMIFGFAGFLWGMSGRTLATNSGFPLLLVSTGIGCLMGVLFGTAAGALVGIGTPHTVAKRYGFYLNEGGTVLTVHLKNSADRKHASQILQTTNAQDISELKESVIWKTIIPEKKSLKNKGDHNLNLIQ